MLLREAIRHLRSRNVVVEWTQKTSDRGRLYKVYDPEDKDPPVWLSAKAVCSLADLDVLLSSLDHKNKDTHGVSG